MKRILLAGATLLALTVAQPTLAADAPVYKGPAPVAAALFNWTGFYVGADAGYLWGRGEVSNPPPGAAPVANPNPDGAVAGGHIGYRYQYPSGIVLGIEMDAWKVFDGRAEAIPVIAPAQAYLLDLDWGASVRGQLGLASGPWLGYVTGGAAFIRYSGCTVAPPGGPCAAGTAFAGDSWGWTVGAGFAYAFTPNLSARLEYHYADFGDKIFVTPLVGSGTTRVDLVTHVVRAGVSWKFASQ